MAKKKFKDRYVLGEGHPWAMGPMRGPYKSIALCKEPYGCDFRHLIFPKELWSDKLPKYRLVLERIEE